MRAYLHAPVLGRGVDQRDPGRHLQGVGALRVEVGRVFFFFFFFLILLYYKSGGREEGGDLGIMNQRRWVDMDGMRIYLLHFINNRGLLTLMPGHDGGIGLWDLDAQVPHFNKCVVVGRWESGSGRG